MTLLFPGFIIGVTLLAVPVVALMASASTQDLEQEREVATWFGGGGAETASRPHGRHVKR